MKKFINPMLIIAVGALMRLVPHPPNFTPIAAIALFGGVYLNKKYALIIPLIALFLSDILIGFHNTMPFVYFSFFLSGLIGIYLKSHKSPKNIFIGAVSSSILFFIITNFGVWLTGNLYTKDFAGFILCYTYALPFFRNTVLGDLFFTGVFFVSFEILKYLVARLRLAKTS